MPNSLIFYIMTEEQHPSVVFHNIDTPDSFEAIHLRELHCDNKKEMDPNDLESVSKKHTDAPGESTHTTNAFDESWSLSMARFISKYSLVIMALTTGLAIWVGTAATKLKITNMDAAAGTSGSTNAPNKLSKANYYVPMDALGLLNTATACCER